MINSLSAEELANKALVNMYRNSNILGSLKIINYMTGSRKDAKVMSLLMYHIQ